MATEGGQNWYQSIHYDVVMMYDVHYANLYDVLPFRQVSFSGGQWVWSRESVTHKKGGSLAIYSFYKILVDLLNFLYHFTLHGRCWWCL
jgi:hypothetical protein